MRPFNKFVSLGPRIKSEGDPRAQKQPCRHAIVRTSGLGPRVKPEDDTIVDGLTPNKNARRSSSDQVRGGSGGRDSSGPEWARPRRGGQYGIFCASHRGGRVPHEAARVLRRRAMAPGRPRTFRIRPVAS